MFDILVVGRPRTLLPRRAGVRAYTLATKLIRDGHQCRRRPPRWRLLRLLRLRARDQLQGGRCHQS